MRARAIKKRIEEQTKKIWKKREKKKREQTKNHDNIFERVSHKLHPVYIVRTMIRSYFGISFFGFAKKIN